MGPDMHQQYLLQQNAPQQNPSQQTAPPKKPRAKGGAKGAKGKGAAAAAAAAASASGDGGDEAAVNASDADTSVADSDTGRQVGAKSKRSDLPKSVSSPNLTKKPRDSTGASPGLPPSHPSTNVGGVAGIAYGTTALTAEQVHEIDDMLERPSGQLEGLQVGVDKSIAADVIGSDMIGSEELLARQKMREQLRGAVGVEGTSSASSQTTYAQLMQVYERQQLAKQLAGKSSLAQRQAEEDSVVGGEDFMLVENIVDSGTLEPLRVALEKETGLRVGVEALEYLSYGLQLHLTNTVEACLKTSTTRRNRTAAHLFVNLHEKIVVCGEYPNPDTTLGMVWGPDVHRILEQEEEMARYEVRRREIEEETSIVRQMKVHDEEKAKAAASAGPGKRKPGQSESDQPWWVKEDNAERTGQLDFEGIARVQFRQQVARDHKLGPFAGRKGQVGVGRGAGGKASPSMEKQAHQQLAEPSHLPDHAAGQIVGGTPSEVATQVGLSSAALPESVTLEDLSAVLNHCAKPRGGGVRSGAVGTSLRKAKVC